MLERYADIGSIRSAAAEAAAEWQSLTAAFASAAGASLQAVAKVGTGLLQARISATGLLLCEIAKALEAGVAREALKPAWRIVTFELDRLSRGVIRPSLYMAGVAADLAAASQAIARPAGAFFLPIVPILPPPAGAENSPESFAAAVETHRPDYEKALIRFARGGEAAALRGMQSALIAIENRNPVAEYRIVIALASAFISALEDGVLTLGSEGRHLFSRIDAVLRAAAKGAPIPDQCIAARLAYVLAQAPGTHKRSAHLQGRLGLKALLSAEPPSIAEFPPPDIFDTVFQAVVDEFENFLAERNDGQAAVKAADRLRIVCSVNAEAMRMAAALESLLSALATKRLARSPEIIDHLSQFMARMLDAVASHDPAELEIVAEEEIEAANRILHDGSLSMVIRDATSLSMSDFFREAAIDARAAFSLVDEADADAGETAAQACVLLETIEAVLKICYQSEGAATVLRTRQKLAEPSDAKLYLPALDALIRYLDTVGSDPEAAQGLLAEIRGKHLKPRTKAPDEDQPIDQEIFDIFLEEAREVVAAIRAAVGQGERPLVDKEHATAARRGFHTLKGSARMAGLMHLGEAMFSAEKVFNTWLVHPLPYPVELSRFAERWAVFAQNACETIAKHGRSEIDEEVILEDCDALLAMAERVSAIEAKQRQAARAAAKAIARPAPPATEPAVEVAATVAAPKEEDRAKTIQPAAAATPAAAVEVPAIAPEPVGAEPAPIAVTQEPPAVAELPEVPVIEEMSAVEAPADDEFDPDLLALYFVESAEMLAKLREQTRAARHALTSFELIRAAHGLAGMSRTVGLPEIAQMALPIEDWASRLSELRHRPPEKDIDAVLAAADEIERCIQSIREGVRLTPDLSLIAGLTVLEAPTEEVPAIAEVPAIVEAAEPPAAEPQPVASQPSERPADEEEIDPLVLNEFAEEATDLLQALDDELVSPSPSIPQINRFLHTFKGGARLCGAMRLGELLHRLENLTARALNPEETKQVLAEVDHGLDEARMMLSVLLTPEGEGAEPTPAAEEVPAVDALQMPIVEEADENVVFRVTSGQISELTGQLDDMRVARDMLAQQLCDAGEAAENIAYPVRRIEELASQIQIEAETQMDAGAKSSDSRFDALEFDRFTALHELTRKLSEAVQDVLAFSDGLSGSLARADRALIQSRSAAEAFALRLAGISRGPLDILEARLKAAVRSAAVTLGKDCHVDLPPSKVRIERAVLDRVAPALDHLVRNSVAHGVEPAEKRLAAGKPAAGTITISARQRGEMAEIVVSDDGGGINVDAVRRKIKERGLEKRYADEDHLLDALFDAGFSTAETLTQVAGRGVGLDVVRDIVIHLGGKVRIENRPGQGASFILTVPVSASFVSGLMLSLGQGVYLLPGASVGGLAVLPAGAVRQALATGKPVMVNGKPVQLVWLGSLVDADTRPLIQNHNKIVLVDGGRTGLLADDVQYMDSLLTKPFSQAAAWGGSILGCAVLHDGRTALIVDPARTLALMPDEPALHDLGAEDEKEEALVLVVDDSITVRKVTSRLLSRHGFRVETAENGKVALEKLHEMGERLPTAILMDIEMPVMDGFEATRQVKANPATTGIPVIIISSRNVDKHIDYAKSMGAEHFLGKPYKEEVLIGLLREYASSGTEPEPVLVR